MERGLLAAYPQLRWVNATLEGVMATVVLAVLVQVEGAAWAMSSTAILLYPVFIAASAVRMRGDASFDSAERRVVTVLFCDLRDFTSLCESQPPEEVVQLLNTFYEKACAVIQDNGGTVNKIMGDGLLALFNAPHEHPDHVAAACRAAHELMYAVDALRSYRGIYQYLQVGIGIDTGSVVVGGIGAASRADTAAIGSVVNRAARLQGVCKETHRRIVLSERIVRALGSRANVVGLGSVKLKGIEEPQTVYAFRYS